MSEGGPGGQERIPVTVLTGFLGAGKTTLLNRWLQGRKPGEVAVLVNEFGEVGVDGALLHAEGRIVEELTDGCVCCIVQESLVTSLALVAARKPARIFLETSGLAEPAPVVEALQYGNLPKLLRHALTVTVADPISLATRLAEPVVLRQIACADRVVLSRADLATQRQLDDARILVSRINPLAQVRLSSMGQLDGEQDLDAWLAGRMRLLARSSQPAPPHEHAPDVGAVAFEHPGSVHPERLGRWLDALALSLGDNLFRTKGILALASSPRSLVLQGVGNCFDLRSGAPWSDEPPSSRLVLIGRSLDRAALARGFLDCCEMDAPKLLLQRYCDWFRTGPMKLLKKKFFLVSTLALGLLAAPGCGDDDENAPVNGAAAGSGGSSGAGGGGTGGGGAGGGSGGDGGGSGGLLQPFTAPADPGNGGILVTVSGEDLAVNGYPFETGVSKSEGDPPAFVDGWEVKFEHLIVTIGSVKLSDNPDKNPDDPKDMGAVVAEAPGPFAVDVRIGGNIVGKSGSPDEKTVAIAAFTGPSAGGGFKTDQRYAFSYDTVAATAQAKNVNLDAGGLALYQQAIDKGWAMVLQGKATYKGKAPAAGTVFEKMPKEVTFTLGFANPASYFNCQNADLNPIGDEEFPRGVQVSASSPTVAQVTIHSDHIFWNKLNVEGTPLHFDPIAAIASTYGTVDAPPGVVTMEDLDALDFLAFKTRGGEPLPARSEVDDFSPPSGTLAFDGNGVTFPKNSFGRFLGYSATSGGHFNADGECEVVLNFSP